MREYSILLVDDEELALLGLREGVHWDSLKITKQYCAGSMNEALRILQEQSVDLMLCDIEMPGGNGIELIRKVRTTYPWIVCIFYTCHADFAYCREALQLGAFDYVLKPIPYEDLEEIISRALLKFQKGKETQELETIWENLTEKQKNPSIEQVKKIISDNIAKEISRDELAAAVFMSPDHLTKLFKKEMGMSLSDYIIHKRILLAQKMLASTELSVVEISQRAGFSYSSYFVRIFKKKTGITPQEYRKENYKKE